MKKNIRIENLIPLFVVLLIFSANPPWFLWGINYPIVFFSALMIFLLNIKTFSKLPKESLGFLIIFMILFAYFSIFKGLGEIRFSTIVFFITLLGGFFLSKENKIKSFNAFTKAYAVVLGVSFIAWFINSFIFELPFKFDLNYAEKLGKFDNLTFYNYILFIQPQLDYVRFYSVFDEPGVVGTLSAFILLGQRYLLTKWYNLIILITTIFTFSMAFYVISFLGMISIFLYEKRFALFSGVFFLIFILSSFLMTNDSFKLVVLNRFNDFDEVFSRRSGGYINQYFSDFLNTNSLFFGNSLDFFQNNKYLIDGQGYKIFIIEYGLIGFVLIFILYFYIFLKNYSFYNFILLVVFLISFLQRPFLLTPWQILLFIIICANLKKVNMVDNVNAK